MGASSSRPRTFLNIYDGMVELPLHIECMTVTHPDTGLCGG
eukprot:COSAG01_NODE_582_length_15201_cov_7.218315_5_plen_41_part_00